MKKICFVLTVLIFLFGASALTGCSESRRAVVPDNSKPTVSAMNFPAYDFARQITGGRANVVLLLSPGADSHSYEPTPADILTIENSDLFIYTGGKSDEWLGRTLASLENDSLSVVKMMDVTDALVEETVEGMETEQGDSDEIEYDEHVWTSPKNAVKISAAIAEKMSEIDPDNAEFYFENLRGYTDELNRLDEDFHNVCENGARKCMVFGDRFPFRYLADEMGLDYRAAFMGCSDETEPSVQTLVYLIDKVRAEKIPVVFTIEFSNKKTAETISEETGAKVLEMHSCHNVSREDFDGGATYVSLMRKNLENLKKALN